MFQVHRVLACQLLAQSTTTFKGFLLNPELKVGFTLLYLLNYKKGSGDAWLSD